MPNSKQQAAKEFAEFWKDRGYEKGESQLFWISLLRDVYGIEHPEKFIEFEDQVHLDNTSFIDGMIPQTKVMIEQKGRGKNLDKPIKQSDGSLLTPFQQAKRYIVELPVDQHPKYVITCNFEEFWVYDMNRPGGDPEKIELKDLEKDYYRLQFLVDSGNRHTEQEEEVSVKAGELVGLLYDAFLKQYKEPESAHSKHSLNVLCVRLVFCLYAENSEIFGSYGMFHDYMESFPTHQMRKALIELFHILDTPLDKRDEYLENDDPKLAAFPYVNGGLFSDEDVEIPPFTDELRELLLEKASAGFNWSKISPTIFGSVFESTLNPETRRKGGMHYTSVENIHKVIDPLFLTDLEAEFEEILSIDAIRAKKKKLEEFQKKLSTLVFLDPAAGSGNFLTETYLSLRRLENKALKELMGNQMSLGLEITNPIKVSLNQFYGIEINDFAVTVAKTALWIAESQMMQETESIVLMDLDFLPLKSYTNIAEGNALRMDWNDVVPKEKLNYIMGNPPFVGYAYQTETQKSDLKELSKNVSGLGKNIDYVAGWYYKSAQLMENTNIRTALVSTNSITQGEQVTSVWKPLYDNYNVHIDFAYQTFRWDSEASIKAHVHCVIVGFSIASNSKPKKLYTKNQYMYVNNINAYLLSAPNVFIERRNKPLCNVPEMVKGSQATDGGNLIIQDNEYNDFIKKEPAAKKYIRPYLGAEEFINGKKRYCLWLVGVLPQELSKMPHVLERLQRVRDFRLESKKTATRKCAETPTLFSEIRQPNTKYVVVPRVSSERRQYIPMGFLWPDTIVSDAIQYVANATLYEFGMLNSNVHNAWMRAVCGRLKSDYRYSNTIVYNNFPWPSPTPEQKAKIEQTSQAILDARNLYPDSSLADLYDDLTMPAELRKAHLENDKAVMAAYGWTSRDEAYHSSAVCVAELMKMYERLAKDL